MGAMRSRGAFSTDTAIIRIAQVAARLMAEHGILDHAQAKRKALRELGLPPGHPLPSNQVIDSALRDYRALFDADASDRELQALRAQALDIMDALRPFQLRLVGAVANGAISRHSEIEFDLCTDTSKSFEQFLLNDGIDFEVRDHASQTSYLLFAEPANVLIRIQPEHSAHVTRRLRDRNSASLTREQLLKLIDRDST